MLKSFLAAVINGLAGPLEGLLPFYPAYIVAVFLALTAYLAFRLVKHTLDNPPEIAGRSFLSNVAFAAVLFLILWFHYEHFIVSSDEKAYFQQALEYARTGRSGLLLSDSIMTFFLGMILYAGNAAALKAVLYLALCVHFLLWKLILEEVFGLGMIAASVLVLCCAIISIYGVQAVVSYMAPGYMLSSLAAYLALKSRPESPGGGRDLLPFVALLAVLFRQECFILFPLILINTLFLREGKTGRLCLLSGAFILSVPVLYSSWKDELKMNKEAFDREFVSECWRSGGQGHRPRAFGLKTEDMETRHKSGARPGEPKGRDRRHLGRRVRRVQTCYKPGISANKSYMLNILLALAGRRNVGEDEIIDLAETLYNAPNPSLQNVYYNLKFRGLWPPLFTGAGFISMFLGIVFLKPLRQALVFLGCMTAFYFIIFYAQKFSAGWFERFYFYLFPLYGCFLAVSVRAAYQRFLNIFAPAARQRL